MEVDRLGEPGFLWSNSEVIAAEMVFKHILTGQTWLVETKLYGPVFEPFPFCDSDTEDCFECVEVAEVEWTMVSHEEIKTSATVPPILPPRLTINP